MGLNCIFLLFQSEKEKQSLKQIRKEERRQARRERALGDEVADDDNETYLKALGFDPEVMRNQRYGNSITVRDHCIIICSLQCNLISLIHLTCEKNQNDFTLSIPSKKKYILPIF